jgi:hypothetical protein
MVNLVKRPWYSRRHALHPVHLPCALLYGNSSITKVLSSSEQSSLDKVLDDDIALPTRLSFLLWSLSCLCRSRSSASFNISALRHLLMSPVLHTVSFFQPLTLSGTLPRCRARTRNSAAWLACFYTSFNHALVSSLCFKIKFSMLTLTYW